MNKFNDIGPWSARYAGVYGIEGTGVNEVPDGYVVDKMPLFRATGGPVFADAGCGPGRHLPLLLEAIPAGGRVIGLEGAETVIPHLRERFAREIRDERLALENCNLNQSITCLRPYKVAAILCTDVLSVVSDPIGVLGNLKEVLLPKGILLLTFQTTEDETIKDGELFDDGLAGTVIKIAPDRHQTPFRFFREDAARRFIENCGFVVQDWTIFKREEPAHVGRPYPHTHVEVGCILRA